MRRSEIKRYRVNFVVMVSTPDVRYELQFTCYLMIWGCCEMLEWLGKAPKTCEKRAQKCIFFGAARRHKRSDAATACALCRRPERARSRGMGTCAQWGGQDVCAVGRLELARGRGAGLFYFDETVPYTGTGITRVALVDDELLSIR